MYGPGDVRVEERDDPKIVEPTDAIIRLSATCICGSDLWPYRGVDDYGWPAPSYQAGASRRNPALNSGSTTSGTANLAAVSRIPSIACSLGFP